MKSKKEIKEWLLENCIDEDGDINLSHLDFSDFDGNIDTSYMKVRKDLKQHGQEVDGTLIQSYQNVKENLIQHNQNVKENLLQDFQKVNGIFITQTLKEDEEYFINEYGRTEIVKKAKKLTHKELDDIVGYKFEIIE